MVYRLENQQVSLTDCRNYISDEIFSFGPKDYEKHHPNWPGSVGLELEMLPILLTNGSPKPLPLFGESPNVVDTILNQKDRKTWKWLGETGDNNQKVITRIELEQGDNLSFEPGGQLEISTLPYPCLSDAVRRLKEVQELIQGSLVKNPQIGVTQIGMNPWHTTEEIGLQLPKKRYDSMNQYFSKIGPYGQKMMRQTCTIQVCLDFGSNEELLTKRYIASQLLSPFAAAIFAYSGVDNKKPVKKGLRRKVWAETDPSRTGLVLTQQMIKHPSKEACVAAYLEFILNAKVIFISALEYEVPQQDISFREWMEKGYNGIFPTFADFKTHLSLMFPEVRPRGFLEIRSVDCQSKPWQFVPAAFYSSLLYDELNLDFIIEQIGSQFSKLDEWMKASEEGLENPELRKLSQILMKKAVEGFERLPTCFSGEGTERALLRFKEHFTDKGRTPASDLLDAIGTELTWDTIQNLEKTWKEFSES